MKLHLDEHFIASHAAGVEAELRRELFPDIQRLLKPGVQCLSKDFFAKWNRVLDGDLQQLSKEEQRAVNEGIRGVAQLNASLRKRGGPCELDALVEQNKIPVIKI